MNCSSDASAGVALCSEDFAIEPLGERRRASPPAPPLSCTDPRGDVEGVSPETTPRSLLLFPGTPRGELVDTDARDDDFGDGPTGSVLDRLSLGEAGGSAVNDARGDLGAELLPVGPEEVCASVDARGLGFGRGPEASVSFKPSFGDRELDDDGFTLLPAGPGVGCTSFDDRGLFDELRRASPGFGEDPQALLSSGLRNERR